MERHGDGGTVGNFQIGGADLNALSAQGVDLLVQMGGVDDHAATHDADNIRTQNTGGDQVQHELAPLVFHGMARVVAALIARHNIVILTEQVHHAALALVAPVDTGDRCKHNKTLISKSGQSAFSGKHRDPPPDPLYHILFQNAKLISF